MPYKNPDDPANIEKARAARRRHYHANKQPYLDRAKAAREEFERYLRGAKDQPCMDCGIKYPYYVMQFDHREGEEKLGLVRQLMGNWRAVRVEIAKCDVVCANCHCERTHVRRVAAGQETVSKTVLPGSQPGTRAKHLPSGAGVPGTT